MSRIDLHKLRGDLFADRCWGPVRDLWRFVRRFMASFEILWGSCGDLCGTRVSPEHVVVFCDFLAELSAFGPAPLLACATFDVFVSVLPAQPPIHTGGVFRQPLKRGARPSAARLFVSPFLVEFAGAGQQQANQNSESCRGKLWGLTSVTKIQLE